MSEQPAALLRLTGVLAVALALAGFSMYALINPTGGRQQTSAALTTSALATDTQTGASLTVHLTEEDGTVTVRATLSGLENGLGYRLYGYPFDGRPRPLVNWTGRRGVQEVSGELSFGIAELSHFTVIRGDRVVVTVYLPRSGIPAAR